MPDAYERHLQHEQERRDAARELDGWWCEDQAAFELDDEGDLEPVDDLDDLDDDEPADHPSSRRIEDVPLTGEVL